MNKHRGLSPLAALLLLSGSLLLSGCNEEKTPGSSAQRPLPEVGVVTLKSQQLPVTTELPGRTSAYRVAEVRPQVSGIILKRNFVEGSNIKAGQSLYQIDPAPYQAQYQNAKGNLAQAEAAAQIAHLTLQRYKPLLGTNYISKQEYDQARSNARTADAQVAAAKATLESARINLAYTRVTSPISGRIGKSAVTEGALVQTGQATALATVQQLDPIYVDVTQSSTEFLRLKKELSDGTLQQDNGQARVALILEDGSLYAHEGKLAFSDVSVDESTGSITVRAIFPNPDHLLLPGMFVRARLNEGVNPDALLVPQQGVTRTPRGSATALVVNADNKVEVRNINAAQAIGDKWLVTEGLKAGDRVIVTGLQKIKVGIPVKATEVTEDNAKKSDNAPATAQSKS